MGSVAMSGVRQWKSADPFTSIPSRTILQNRSNRRVGLTLPTFLSSMRQMTTSRQECDYRRAVRLLNLNGVELVILDEEVLTHACGFALPAERFNACVASTG
jgi:hypothetical protein